MHDAWPEPENEPGEHWAVGAARLEVAQYEPAVQAVQRDVVPPPAEKDPGEHEPETAAKPMLLQYLPGVQLVHARPAPPAEKVPIGHCAVGFVRPVDAQ